MFFIFIIIILFLTVSLVVYNLFISSEADSQDFISNSDYNNSDITDNQNQYGYSVLENSEVDFEKPPRPPE
jgi:hypothetical protein